MHRGPVFVRSTIEECLIEAHQAPSAIEMGFRWAVLTPSSRPIDTQCRWGLGPRGRQLIDGHEVTGYMQPTFLTRDSTREHALFKISLGQHITKTSKVTHHEAAAAPFLKANQWHTFDGLHLVRHIERDRLERKRRRSNEIVQVSGKFSWYLKNPSSWRPPRCVVFFVGTHNHHVPT